jgi:hypothetical protein
MPVTINRNASVGTGQVGMWSSYGPYGECSLRCDYGIQTRRRVCERLPCTGPASETKVCNPYNCPGKYSFMYPPTSHGLAMSR